MNQNNNGWTPIEIQVTYWRKHYCPWRMWVCPIGSGKPNLTGDYEIDHEGPNYFWLLPAYFYWVAEHTGFATDTPSH